MNNTDPIKQENLDNLDPELFEPELREPTRREKIFRVVRVVVAILVVMGMVYLSGLYQFFFYQRTSPAIEQEILGSALDVEEMVLPLNVFVLRSEGRLGSQRLKEDVVRLVENASRVWGQASVALEIENLTFLQMKDEELDLFFSNPGIFVQNIEGYDYERVNVFLLGALNGINGVAFVGLRSVAVADYTTVYDFRALAHEIGHILGLTHVSSSRNRLMYRGVNGFELSLEEITRAREMIPGFLGL